MSRPAPFTPEKQLPEGDEIQRLHEVEGHTFQAIADRYGVTRQAVHKALKTWKRREAEKMTQ